jgi:hypothetical protein
MRDLAALEGVQGEGAGEDRSERTSECVSEDRSRQRTHWASTGAALVGGGPGLLLDYQITLDREDAAAFAQIKELDQVGIDVQLRAILTESTGDAEAQPLAPIREPERGVEPGRDEPAAADGASIAGA